MTFEYKVETADGENVVLVLRPITEVPIGILRRNRGNDEEQMFSTLEWGLDKKNLEILDKLPATLLEDIVRAWQSNAGVTLGESAASSGSSKPTARRSKPTSSA
jgi:hypothetical protein